MIDPYLTETITWRRSAGLDRWGTPLPPPPDTQVKALVEWETRLVYNLAGEQVVSAGRISVKAEPSHQDNFVVDGVEHAILSIAPMRAFGVLSHYEVSVQ